MSDEASTASAPLSAAELRAARLRYFVPSAGDGSAPDPPSDTIATLPPASSSTPEPSALCASLDFETAPAALTKELHDMYMATYPVCAQMAHAFLRKGVSELSHFRGVALDDLKQQLAEFYSFSGIQVRRVHAHLNPSEYPDLYLSAPEQQVVVVSSTASTSDASAPVVSDDDLPIVSIPVSRGPKPSTKRSRTTSFFDNLPIQLQTAEFPTEDAIKRALTGCNPSCHPRSRSSAGKYVRFGCKHAKASIPCPLNISGIRRQGYITLSPNTYVAGNCNHRLCICCHQDITFFATCPNEHLFCVECFDNLVRVQVRTDRASFIASNCVVFCRFCEPPSIIEMQTHCTALTRDTWQHYLEACTESAVVCEQKKWEARGLTIPAINDELAFLADLVSRKCPICHRYMADDFDGCVALKCGRTMHAAGAGCGADLCAYCGAAFNSEADVHQHLKTCMFNFIPEAGIFPTPALFQTVMWEIRRERVWLHVLETLPNQIPTIWSAIAKTHPELKLTSDWLEHRAKCLEIAQEFSIPTAEFAKLVPKYLKCITSLKEIFGGENDEDEQKLWRACIINTGNYEKTVRTLIDNCT
jgi:hypothetical protein